MTDGMTILLFQYFNKAMWRCNICMYLITVKKLVCGKHMWYFVARDEQSTQIVCRYFLCYSSSKVKQFCVIVV